MAELGTAGVLPNGRVVAIGVAVVGLDAAYPAAALDAATTLAATPDPARAGAAPTSAATQSAPGADPD